MKRPAAPSPDSAVEVSQIGAGVGLRLLRVSFRLDAAASASAGHGPLRGPAHRRRHRADAVNPLGPYGCCALRARTFRCAKCPRG